MERSAVIVQHASAQRSFVTRQIAGETLIVPVTGNVVDLESIYVLNAVGSRIWDLLRSPTTPNRIADVVADVFDVSLQVATADVLEFIDALGARELLQPADNG